MEVLLDESDAIKLSVISPFLLSGFIITSIVAIVLYGYVFSGYWRNRKDAMMESLFTHLFLMHSIVNIVFIIYNAFIGLPRHFPITWHYFYELNETVWVSLFEVIMVFLIVAQMLGVAFMAVERLIGTIDGLSWPHELLEKIPRPWYFVLYMTIPVICISHYYDADRPFFYYDDTQSLIALYTMHHGKIQTKIVGPLIIFCALISVICYGIIILREAWILRREWQSHVIEDEMKMNVLGIFLIIPLMSGALFALLGRQAKEDGDLERALWLKAHLIFIQYGMAILGPILLLFSHRSRSLMFGHHQKPPTRSINLEMLP